MFRKYQGGTKPLLCVKKDKEVEYTCADLTSALKWIARKCGQPMRNVSVIEAISLGFCIDYV